MIAGVNIDEIGVGKTKDDVLINITTQFNLSMKRLLILAQKYIKNNKHMDLVTKMVKWGDKFIPSQLIHKSYKNFLQDEAKENILNRNIDFFVEKEYDDYIKHDEFKKPLDFMITLLKERIDELSREEMNYIWDLICIMLICSHEYFKYLIKYKINIKCELS